MLSKANCLEMGGHCWEETGYYLKDAVVGGTTVGYEFCKHCPAQRKKTSQPEWRYEEIQDRA